MLPIAVVAAETVTTTGNQIASSISDGMLNGVLQEVISLLPVVIPVMVSFIAIRKGIAFLSSMLHSA